MIWAASYMTFAMVVPGQTTKCTCEAIGKAFQYFGYIPYNLQFEMEQQLLLNIRLAQRQFLMIHSITL